MRSANASSCRRDLIAACELLHPVFDRATSLGQRDCVLRIPGEEDEPAIDLAAPARAQGVAATGPVERLGDLAGALDEALDAVAPGKPWLLDVVVEAG